MIKSTVRQGFDLEKKKKKNGVQKKTNNGGRVDNHTAADYFTIFNIKLAIPRAIAPNFMSPLISPPMNTTASDAFGFKNLPCTCISKALLRVPKCSANAGSWGDVFNMINILPSKVGVLKGMGALELGLMAVLDKVSCIFSVGKRGYISWGSLVDLVVVVELVGLVEMDGDDGDDGDDGGDANDESEEGGVVVLDFNALGGG